MADLDELRRNVDADPVMVLEEIARLLEARGAEPSTESRLHALAARARLAVGEVELAEQAARRSVSLARSIDAFQLEADAQLALASVLVFGGRLPDAFACLDRVIETGNESQRRDERLQRAALLVRSGSPAQALAVYRSVLPSLGSPDDLVDRARVLANIGVIEVEAGNVSAGIAALTEARTCFVEAGQEFAVGQMSHNIGWAYGRLGNTPMALAFFDESVQAFASVGHRPEETAFERAEVLLAGGLWADALSVGLAAAPSLEAAGNRASAAETWLLCSAAARLGTEMDLAQEYARRAAELFDELDSPAGSSLARLAALQAGFARDRSLTDLADVAQLERSFSVMGNTRAALSAAVLLTEAAGKVGLSDLAERAAGRAARFGRGIGTLDAQAQVSLALAVAAESRGDLSRANRHVRAGLERLDLEQAVQPAAHLRAELARQTRSLASLQLRLALRSGDVGEVFNALEATRSTALVRRSVNVEFDAATTGPLARLRALYAERRAAELAGDVSTMGWEEERELEAQVRAAEMRRRLAPGDRVPELDLEDVRGRLGEYCLIELAEAEGRVVVLTVSGPRGARIETGGSAHDLQRAGNSAQRALSALASPTSRQRVQRWRSLEASAEAMDHALGGLVPDAQRVVLVTPPSWSAFPWRSLPSLSGIPVTVTPSARWWAATSSTRGAVEKVALCCGPNLAWGAQEVELLRGIYPDEIVLLGPDCSVERVLEVADRGDLLHVVAHGRRRSDNPAWSSIELFDGSLLVSDIERLERAPTVVVLSACDAANAEPASGDELLGLGAALLATGTRTVVAATGPIPDAPTTGAVMRRLHLAVRAGTPFSEVLADLTREEMADRGEILPVATCMAVIGRD